MMKHLDNYAYIIASALLIPSLARAEISASVGYKGEVNSTFAGGAKTGTTYLDNLDLKLSGNAKAVGAPGLSFLIHALGNHGGDPTEYVGDAQSTSNIESPDTFKLYQVWLQQNLYDDSLSFLAGLYDLNGEFYVTNSSGVLLNSSFGVGKDLSQTGKNGPSVFPTTSLALRMRLKLQQDIYLQTGVFDGTAGNPDKVYGTHIHTPNADDGFLLISEFGYAHEGEDHPAKYALGVWTYTATFDHLSRVDIHGDVIPSTNYGVYLLGDQSLGSGWSTFGRVGLASEKVNPFKMNWALGVNAKGLIPSRDSDTLAFGITQVRMGNAYREVNPGTLAAETAFELSYRCEFYSHFALQPDLQWVQHPSANPDIHNAWVGALRVEALY
ncbi:MAG: carbohydrate porin [Bdellovibrionales bacterium]|nr:carbohydrate porin [Bdellovibrionales bacterium]